MENYNFFAIEEKWKDFFNKNKIFKTNNNNKKKILLFRDVSISFWKYSYGTCKKLHSR